MEVEDFGIAFAVGDAAVLENAYPPLRLEVAPDDEGPSEGEDRPSIKALI